MKTFWVIFAWVVFGIVATIYQHGNWNAPANELFQIWFWVGIFASPWIGLILMFKFYKMFWGGLTRYTSREWHRGYYMDDEL